MRVTPESGGRPLSYRSYRCGASLVLALVLSACASSSDTAFGGESATTARARGTSTLIIRAELNERPGESAYQVIQALRPLWLRSRERSLSGRLLYARVVVDGAIRGEVDELYRLRADNIEEIQYLTAGDATTKYGTGYAAGVIEVRTRGRLSLRSALQGEGLASLKIGADANCAWRVCVTYIDTPSGRALQAVNREPVPVTVVLTFRPSGNLRPGADLPIERVVPPESSAVLVRLRTIVQDESIRARLTIAIDLGSSTTEPDADHLYAVPFGGDSRRELIQGFKGTDTHLASMRYSLDFAMPEGTPVLAARAGTVLYLQDAFTVGRADPDLLERANLVVVAHGDGTMASYGHLTPGIPVSVGDTVAEGDVLGLSGLTGFTGQPHLHFHVGRRMLRAPGRTIPIKLKGRGGRLLDLTVGSLIEPTRRNR